MRVEVDMSSVFYVIKVEVDSEGNPVAGSEEAVGLLTHPAAIDQAIEELRANQERQAQSKVNSSGSQTLN
jgi:hypothetical protein